MKLNELIINIISILFFIPLYYFTKDSNIFLYTLSFYLYIILSNVFSHIDIYNNLKKYYDNDCIYSINTIFKYTNISIIIINIILTTLTFIISLILNNIFNIKGLIIVNVVMSLTLFIKPILKNIASFCKTYTFKNLSNNIFNIYKILNTILLLLNSFLCFKVFKLPSYISISILYITSIISFILVYLLCNSIVLSNKIKKKQFKKLKERIDYKKEIIKILSTNNIKSIIKIINSSYFYFSIIILYFMLINKYNYSFVKTTTLLNNCFLYSMAIINIIFLIIYYLEQDKLELLKDNIILKKYELVKLDDYLIGLFRKLLTLIVFLSIISDSIWTLIFNNNMGYIFYMFSNLAIFYIMYLFVVKIFINIMKDKKLFLIVISGLIIKLLLIVPLITSLHKLGYNLLYGDMFTSVLGLFVSMVMLIIANSSKIKFDFMKKFDTILDIIYNNILLCFLLLLFSLIVSIDVTNRIESVKVILLYLFIAIIYIFIRKKLDKNERINNKH